MCGQRKRKARRRAKVLAQGGSLAKFGEVMKLADELFSVAVRAEATGCRMCTIPLSPSQLQWAHHETRQVRHIRYNPINWSVLCSACHRTHTPAGPEFWAWLREERLGPEDYENLQFIARSRGKLTRDDLDLVIMDARQRIHALPSGPRREWALDREAKIMERAA